MCRGRVRRSASELPLVSGRGRAHPRLATWVGVGQWAAERAGSVTDTSTYSDRTYVATAAFRQETNNHWLPHL